MELKLNDDGSAAVENGMPVYVHTDGKEIAFDAPGTLGTITRLNSEAKNHRIAKETAETSLKAFAGIDDPAAAISALETIKGMDGGKLIEAEGVAEAQSAAIKAAVLGVEEKYAPVTEDNARLTSELYQERVGGQFARSKFIADKCAIPADIMQSQFGKNFKDEDGKAVGYDNNGNKILSRENPGEAASFDEALEIMVGGYVNKDSILKGTGGGSGAQAANGGQSGAKTITRADFDKLTPADQMAKMNTDGFTVTD